jgi:epoxyqueuosine reductase
MRYSRAMETTSDTSLDFSAFAQQIKQWGKMLGFQQLGITDNHLEAAEKDLLQWLQAGHHGQMDYMARHGEKRSRPEALVPGTVRVISVRMNYLPEPQARLREQLHDPAAAFISRYALGRDYHKLMRKRLQQLARLIETRCGSFGYRVFVDSAPVMEKPLAQKAGLGWIGKHTNLINAQAGSWFFLGEIYTSLPLPIDAPTSSHCGTCSACIEACPSQAIIAPYQLDARRCISYLTIELKGRIAESLRPLIGNRIYGCDDCQLICPWNRFAQLTAEADFMPRQALDRQTLLALFNWDEAQFLRRTEGSAIRRIGHVSWLRNIAVALGNGTASPEVLHALGQRAGHAHETVREHAAWALRRLSPGCKI